MAHAERSAIEMDKYNTILGPLLLVGRVYMKYANNQLWPICLMNYIG